MKTIKMLFAMLFICSMSFAQSQANAIDKYFKQYVEDDRFTVVFISPKLFQMIGKLDVEGLDIEDEEAKAFVEMAKDLKGLRVLVAEENASGLYEEAKKKINTSEYEVLMTVRDGDGSNVDFLVLDSDGGNVIEELLLLVGGEDEFVLLSFVGNIDLNKVSQLAKSIDEGDDDDDDDEESGSQK